MHAQMKFYKKVNLDLGTKASAHACHYHNARDVTMLVFAENSGEQRIRMNADEAELLAAHLLQAAAKLREMYAA